MKAKQNLDYFFIGWEESDSHDECVAKFGKWHVPEANSTILCCARINVQMCLLNQWNGLSNWN